MSTVQEIEDAVRQLTADERAAFRAWFAGFDAQEWDRQIESDSAAGRLDWLIAECEEKGGSRDDSPKARQQRGIRPTG